MLYFQTQDTGIPRRCVHDHQGRHKSLRRPGQQSPLHPTAQQPSSITVIIYIQLSPVECADNHAKQKRVRNQSWAANALLATKPFFLFCPSTLPRFRSLSKPWRVWNNMHHTMWISWPSVHKNLTCPSPRLPWPPSNHIPFSKSSSDPTITSAFVSQL